MARHAPAETPDPYEVKGVKVDVTAENAALAREQALSEAEQKAFRLLVTRLSGEQAAARVEKVPAATVSRLVKDFSIIEEKTSRVRYIAALDVRFNAKAVRDLLSRYDLAVSDQPPRPLVVVAVFRKDGANAVLWDSPNPWRDAWDVASTREHYQPLIVPTGDLADVGTLSAEQAMAGDLDRIISLARRYQATDVLLVAAAMAPVEEGSGDLTVTAARFAAQGEVFRFEKSFPREAGETDEALLSRAVAAVNAEAREQARLAGKAVSASQKASLQMSVPITGLKDWVSMRKSLAEVPVVRAIDVLHVSRSDVALTLHYLGDPDSLQAALARAGLSLGREGDTWVLRPGGVVPAEPS